MRTVIFSKRQVEQSKSKVGILRTGNTVDVSQWAIMPRKVLVKFGDGWFPKLAFPCQDGWLIIGKTGLMASYVNSVRVKPYPTTVKHA